MDVYTHSEMFLCPISIYLHSESDQDTVAKEFWTSLNTTDPSVSTRIGLPVPTDHMTIVYLYFFPLLCLGILGIVAVILRLEYDKQFRQRFLNI